MIFVTVGWHYQEFVRLIRKMDEMAGKMGEKVIMQVGFTKYRPKNAEYFDFVEDFQKILELNREARVVVTHAGAGSIVTALEQGTPAVVVPRLRKYREAIDDHQLELARALAEEGKVVAVYDVNDLEKALRNVKRSRIKVRKDKRLINFLKSYIRSLERQSE